MLQLFPFHDHARWTLNLNADGSFTYVHDGSDNLSDNFRYRVSDGNGGSDTATISITVDPVNDAPAPVADAVRTNEDTAITIAVLDNDEFWKHVEDISQVPDILVERLRHYFGTYKMMPGGTSQMAIKSVYDREYALKVVAAAMEDYAEAYGI